LALPPLMGSDCSIATASDAPQRLALLVIDSRPHDPGAPCLLYLSGDGGATWTHAPYTVALSPDAGARTCAIWLNAHSLYMLSTYQTAQGALAPAATLERTDDGGRTWARADADLGVSAMFASLTLNGGTLIAGINRVGSREGVGEVWVSHDGGRHWRHTSNLGGVPP